jgi:hypothetical protein
MADTIYVRGEGGGIHPMDLPLPEPIADRLAKGTLVRVNADGSPYTAPARAAKPAQEPPPAPDGGTPTSDTGDNGADGDDVPGPPTKAPAKADAKAAWVAWAIACGANPDDAEAMTKTDLIDTYSNQ